MTLEQPIIEENNGAIRTLWLNRPKIHNALSLELVHALKDHVQKAAQDKAVRALILRGQGKAFSAGGDLKYLHQNIKSSDKIFDEISATLNDIIAAITTMPKAVIAAVHGPAFAAGFGLALSCDLLVATPGAKLSPSFVNIAIAPNAATTHFLPRIIGPKRAAEAFFRGEVFSAKEAHHLKMINHIWEEADFEKELQALAEDLAQRPYESIARSKKLLSLTYQQDLKAQTKLERQEIAASSKHPDFAEGLNAFFGKRAAKFS